MTSATTYSWTAWCLADELTSNQIQLAFIAFLIILNSYAIWTYFIIQPAKRYAWAISLLNSFCMCIVGAIYVVLKNNQHPNMFYFNYDADSLFYGRDNLGLLICIWFGLANALDFIYGLILYRVHLGFLTTYVHHSIFIWLMYFCSTRNGFFVTAPSPFIPAFCIMLIEEIPTFLLALGTVFPSFRTDLGFGVTFFLLRIVYHAYITTYAIYAQVTTSIIVLYLLTLTMHCNWFYAWVTKYGRKSLGRGKAAKADDVKKDH